MTRITLAVALFCSITSFSQAIYDIDSIAEIKLYFDDPNWDGTMDTYYANDLDELLYGTAEVNGESFDSVGVAFKGNSTYNASNAKNPLKIKLADVYDFQNIQGFRTLKLSNGDKDPSFVREVLSYEIGRQYMDMPLSNYAKVYINDNYYGLFASSESVNGDFMENRFYCDRDNSRIKCNPVSVMDGSSLAYLGIDSTLYYDYYELKSDFGWGDLVQLCNVIANYPSLIESYLDVDRALWMLAFNNVLVNLDSYSGPFRQNYYLIMDDYGRMNSVIWDLNQCIGSFSMVDAPGGGPPSPTSLSDLTDMDPLLRENDTDFPLIYYLFANDRYKKMYLAHCKTILEENISNGWYFTRAQELQSIIATEVQNEPNAIYSYAQFTGNLTSQQGSGMGGGTFGLSEVMDGRATYLSAHADFNHLEPTISNVTASPAIPTAYSTVTFTADISDADFAYLGYREYKAEHFTKYEMFDDGLHGDGAAADGVWGVQLVLTASDAQYYIYADNADAGKFSPVRAEHEFYELTLSNEVVINELMASNNETAADEYGEFDDWIELYNNSSNTVDLSGYLLSDDINLPAKWALPLGTTIGPGEYLIVWADGDDGSQIGLHTNFELDAGGEYVILSDPTGIPINSIQFPEVYDNGTYGRYPNGTGGFIPMASTFAAENSYTSVGVEEEVLSSLNLFPNPTTDYIQLDWGSADSRLLQIFDLSGKKLLEQTVESNGQIDVAHFSAGTYVVHFPELGESRKFQKR